MIIYECEHLTVSLNETGGKTYSISQSNKKDYRDWLFIYNNYLNQPERSKRENSQSEMRCSEHCGNTVREVQ